MVVVMVMPSVWLFVGKTVGTVIRQVIQLQSRQNSMSGETRKGWKNSVCAELPQSSLCHAYGGGYGL